MDLTCHGCGRRVDVKQPLGRRDVCPECDADLHCCLQCQSFDPHNPNECREPQAEVQRDKGQGNFCDLFRAGDAEVSKGDEAEKAAAAFDALFAKKK